MPLVEYNEDYLTYSAERLNGVEGRTVTLVKIYHLYESWTHI